MIDLIKQYLLKCDTPEDIPTVIVTWAQTMDGFMSNQEGKPSAISSSESLIVTHTIRSISQGILVGINTVIADNPILTCRLEGDHKSPIPVILDSKLRIPLNSRILERDPIICTTINANSVARQQLENLGVRIVLIDHDADGMINIPSLLPILKSRFGINVLMVEGGSKVINRFFYYKLAHLIIMTMAPKFFGHGVSLASSSNENGRYLPFDVGSAMFSQQGPDIVMIGNTLFT